ncbi:hypothetical protein ACT3XG_14850 [Paenibacillus polymyxa]|uniref:hypothetical protein n=2 Tax=Paenibacillus TaxID=44249 RepID=UPI001CD2CEC4|nr:hypothetical protein [Paenibacillus polymyxa]UBS85435.1 hypothetical protein LAZ93_14805 [Paenibacillus polymyxa]WHX33954.1 hypothetical protein QNH38_15285 [Paenibacillus polymyxa]
MTRKMRSPIANSDGNRTFNTLTSKPEFHINRNKRAVTVLVRGIYGNAILEKGIAKAAPDDVFHAEIGKAIALRRALGLMVPSEYTNAPKPDEPRVGSVVRGVDHDMYDGGKVGVVTALRPTEFMSAELGLVVDGFAGTGWNLIGNVSILDDTDVDYSVITEGVAA